jgi:asparagine synthase (glutamine-hydrolysing)
VGGILGIWRRDGEPVDTATLARMSATIRHRGPAGEDQRVDGPIACVQYRLEQPSRAAEDAPRNAEIFNGLLLALDGELHNRDDLAAALRLTTPATDETCIVAAYRAWGDRFAERLNGDFAFGIFDTRAQRLILARDAIGVRPLYYFCDHRLVVFASEIKAILAHPLVPRAACDDGLADFLLLGSRPVDRQEVTCFAGIAALVPAHVCLVTAGGLVTRRYWDFDPDLQIRLRSFDEYGEAFHERFSRAVERRTRSPRRVAVSVSGGFDSSSIFCEIEAQRRIRRPHNLPPYGVSYFGREGTDADERRYLLEIEREYGVVVDRFPMEPLQGLLAGAEDQIRAIEAPFIDYMWGVTREVHRRAAGSGARTLLAGTWGDQVLFSSAYLADLFGALRWSTVRRHLVEYRAWFGSPEARLLARRFIVDAGRRYLPTGVLPLAKWMRRRLTRTETQKPWFTRSFLQTALRFADTPVRLPHTFHSAHARSIYVEARSKYHVHCLEWNNKIAALHGMTAAFPFLDRDVVQFLMAVPGDVQNRHGVPRALARQAMRGILPEAIRARKWKADFSQVVNGGVAADAGAIRQILTRNASSVAYNYLDPGTLETAVSRLTAGTQADCVDSWDVADLVGLEIWLQVFFAKPGSTFAGVPTIGVSG